MNDDRLLTDILMEDSKSVIATSRDACLDELRMKRVKPDYAVLQRSKETALLELKRRSNRRKIKIMMVAAAVAVMTFIALLFLHNSNTVKTIPSGPPAVAGVTPPPGHGPLYSDSGIRIDIATPSQNLFSPGLVNTTPPFPIDYRSIVHQSDLVMAGTVESEPGPTSVCIEYSTGTASIDIEYTDHPEFEGFETVVAFDDGRKTFQFIRRE